MRGAVHVAMETIRAMSEASSMGSVSSNAVCVCACVRVCAQPTLEFGKSSARPHPAHKYYVFEVRVCVRACVCV
jgi:hypothetical protein